MFQLLSLLSILLLSLGVVAKSAHFANHYSTRIAKSLVLPRYVIGFLVVAVISILPELFISITSAKQGMPSFGLGTLFGSNVADLTLVLAIVILFARRNVRVESKVIKNQLVYLGTMTVALVFGLNGYYSRFEGLMLILAGMCYYAFVLRGEWTTGRAAAERFSVKDVLLLGVSMAALLVGASMTVKYGVHFANSLKISPTLIGMFVVGLGTTLPELFFSLKAVRDKHDNLALGDILGTVIADATIVVGIIAAINPFSFDRRIIYVTGFCMLLAALLLFYCMKTGRVLTRREALLLLAFYAAFVLVELQVNTAAF